MIIPGIGFISLSGVKSIQKIVGRFVLLIIFKSWDIVVILIYFSLCWYLHALFPWSCLPFLSLLCLVESIPDTFCYFILNISFVLCYLFVSSSVAHGLLAFPFLLLISLSILTTFSLHATDILSFFVDWFIDIVFSFRSWLFLLENFWIFCCCFTHLIIFKFINLNSVRLFWRNYIVLFLAFVHQGLLITSLILESMV